jgi:hypothetical protein
MDAFEQNENAQPATPAEPVAAVPAGPDVTQEAEPVQAQSADVPDDFVPETELDGDGQINIDNGKDD